MSAPGLNESSGAFNLVKSQNPQTLAVIRPILSITFWRISSFSSSSYLRISGLYLIDL